MIKLQAKIFNLFILPSFPMEYTLGVWGILILLIAVLVILKSFEFTPIIQGYGFKI